MLFNLDRFNLDRFCRNIIPAPPADIPPEDIPQEERCMTAARAMAAVTALSVARSAVGDFLDYIEISIQKGRLGVLVNNLRDLDQVPGEVRIIEHNGGKDSPFSHYAEKEFGGVVFFTYVGEYELRCPLEG